MKKCLSLLIMLASAPLAAQNTPTPQTSLSLTETAERLARGGARNQNARAVMGAAELLRIVERGTPRTQRSGRAEGPTGPWNGAMTSAALFQLASSIAADQNDWATAEYTAWLMQLPDSVPVSRGAAGGPVWADAYIGVGREVTYIVEFEGGITANLLQVSAARPRSVLQCALSETSDPRQRTVRVASLAGTCSIEWRQATRGKVTLKIRNMGPPTYFVVSSN